MKKPKPKSAKESCVETSNLVLPSHTNALGTIFGGVIMGWIDIAAASPQGGESPGAERPEGHGVISTT